MLSTRLRHRALCWAVALLATTTLAGCERFMANMYHQPRYKPGEAAPLFADGQSERPPPPGTVPHAALPNAAAPQADTPDKAPPPPGLNGQPGLVPQAVMSRGQQRYGIFCMPCHGLDGYGDGPVAQRGFPAPPSYHVERLRSAGDQHLYDVISRGHGLMPAYGDRIAPPDRWAIVAFVRALQLSQHAPVRQLPEADRPRPSRAASMPRAS